MFVSKVTDFMYYAIVLYYHSENGAELKTWINFTDGCAKQYKGKANFKFVSDAFTTMGVHLKHIFAATSHFKGYHDTIGGIVKRRLHDWVRMGLVVVSTPRQFFNFTEAQFNHECSDESFRDKWTKCKAKSWRAEWIDQDDVDRDESLESKLDGIEKTQSFHHFESFVGESGQYIPPNEMIEMESGRDYTMQYKLRCRLLTCVCSKCRVGNYEECYLREVSFIGPMRTEIIRETIAGSRSVDIDNLNASEIAKLTDWAVKRALKAKGWLEDSSASVKSNAMDRKVRLLHGLMNEAPEESDRRRMLNLQLEYILSRVQNRAATAESPSTDGSEKTVSDLLTSTNTFLQKALSHRHVRTRGTKKELLKRLFEHMKQHDSPDDVRKSELERALAQLVADEQVS